MGSGPIRTCAGCRSRRPQASLIRVVRSSDGAITVDPAARGGLQGRGAYVCPRRSCVEQALDSGRLRRALKHEDGLDEGLLTELLARASE